RRHADPLLRSFDELERYRRQGETGGRGPEREDDAAAEGTGRLSESSDASEQQGGNAEEDGLGLHEQLLSRTNRLLASSAGIPFRNTARSRRPIRLGPGSEGRRRSVLVSHFARRIVSGVDATASILRNR